MKRFVLNLALSLVVVSFAATTARAQETPGAQETTTSAAVMELALSDLSGVEQRLSALRGRIVVLNFWATYCVPCRREMPDLASIQNNYAAFGVQVIGATADDPAARTKVLEFIRETKLNFPVWLGATVGDMERFALAPVLPGTAIIGRDGRIAWHKSGVIKEADVKKKIDELLAQTAKEEPDDAPVSATAQTRAAESAQVETPDKPREEHASSVPS